PKSIAIDSASSLATDDLYDVYVKKLKALEDKKTGSPTRHSSKLVKNVVDYVRVLEERIRRLEENQSRQQTNDTSSPDLVDGSLPSAVGGADYLTGDPNKTGSENQSLEVKFFPSATEFNRQGKYTPSSEKSDSFSCETDHQHFLRVLFNRAEGAVQSQPHGHHRPNANEIDLVGLRIHSDPIAEFLKAEGDLSTNLQPSLRMKKPFRPLLQNFHKFKAQLSKLERMFTPTHESKLSELNTDGTPAGETLPFPEEASYDRLEALGHFKELISFMTEYLSKQVQYLDCIKEGKESKISFENLWMLFDTGTTIYCSSRESKQIREYTSQPQYVPQAFRVVGAVGGLPLTPSFAPNIDDSRDSSTPVSSSRRMKNMFSSLYVFCFNIDFDGVKYGVVEQIFMFKPFHGQVDIQSLEAYPEQFLRPDKAGDHPMLNLSERGEQFIDATLVSHLAYEGLTVGKIREEVESDVIVDFKLAYTEKHGVSSEPNAITPNFTSLQEFWPVPDDDNMQELANRGCGIAVCTIPGCGNDAYYSSQKTQVDKIKAEVKQLLEEYEPGDQRSEKDLAKFKRNMKSERLLHLLPGVVPGFALRNKTWVLLDLTLLKQPEKIEDWNQLVLPKGHRDMVQAMVETYAEGSHDVSSAPKARQAHAAMDIVRGKGKGCIILLHGVPGVGKTSTAECIAAYTGRPLYPITCGDIGYAPEKVEENMEKHFRLAHRWRCVLLLDEADVFLAKRNKADVKRNGLVSVFLRILEYYSGILFLTTNRVGAIDDAFRSRLHLTLYYPKLSGKQTKTIWKNNLERLKIINQKREKEQDPLIDFDKKKILKWVELNWETLQWNGRQIRNAFQTALALAEFEAKNFGDSPPEPTLEVKHFLTIADATTRFNEYLLATHGFDEDETARRDKLRTVGFTPMTRVKDLPESSSSEDSSDDNEDDLSDDNDESDAKQKRKSKSKSKDKRKKSKENDETERKLRKKEKKASKKRALADSEEDDDDESETENTAAVKKRERRKSNK
ncbi:hypothetical protein FSARC_8851, partial [Fusarium sarcochroum]